MAALCSTLDKFLPHSCSYIRPEGGYFVWITLPEYADMNAFVPWCQEKYKLSAIPGSKFSLNGTCKNHLRLAIAFHSKETLIEAAEKLCIALAEFLNADK
jgi:Transcriptional regulators containing a DNA-binding HTH domain and an aminotransferase domain (MocR family) and their eukaryotic orthologs